MPIVTSSFSPPRLLRSATAQTILPATLRHPPSSPSRFEVLSLPDGDFLELEWSVALTSNSRNELVILTHGLEGSTKSSYIVGLIHTLTHQGYDVLAWNMRGCGKERNKLPIWYHSGKSEDLRAIVNFAIQKVPTKRISLVGISVGGNILCKYLGEEGLRVPSTISQAVAVSVPLDLRGSAEVLARPSRAAYMRHLLRPLRARIREKASRFPEHFDLNGLNSIRTFREFDARYTAPMHGFSSVDEYWDRCSGIGFLSGISTPILIITALDDPFLSKSCYPHDLAQKSNTIFFETPSHGGHVGFIESLNLRKTWLESRITSWISGCQV